MSFNELVAELRRLKISLRSSANVAAPDLVIEPRASVIPELVETLRTHKAALIDYITRDLEEVPLGVGLGSSSLATSP